MDGTILNVPVFAFSNLARIACQFAQAPFLAFSPVFGGLPGLGGMLGASNALEQVGNRRKIIHHLLEEKLHFILRLKRDRHLIYRGRKQSVYEHALACPLLYAERIVKEERGKEKIYHLEFGYRPVKLPGRKEQLYMVVVRGFGQEPMMLLTNIRVKKSQKVLWRS